MRRLLAIVASLSLLGCVAGDQEPHEDLERFGEWVAEFPWRINRDFDILLVIDDSPSMLEEQAALRANLERFADRIENIAGGSINTHIAVVSTGMGAGGHVAGCDEPKDGLFQVSPRGDCQPPAGNFIRDYALSYSNERDRNFDGSLADVLTCIAPLGTEGCARPQPLAAMRRALDGSNPGNDGFLRDDAYLMVLFVTDSDDCSVRDPALFDPDDTDLGPPTAFRCFEHGVECAPDDPTFPAAHYDCRPRADSAWVEDVTYYADFLGGLKDDPGMIWVGAIAGDASPVLVDVDSDGYPVLEPSCSSKLARATPSIRLQALLEEFPNRGFHESICDSDWSAPLERLTPLMTLGVPCVNADIDLDPAPGLQYDCTASVMRADGGGGFTDTLMPECTSADPPGIERPCWRFEQEPGLCTHTPHELVFTVEQSGESVPWGAWYELRCVIEL